MNGKAWLELALDGGGRVWGYTYTKKECYIRSLELDPECASAWHNLGVQCGGRLGGRDFSTRECYACSLVCDPSCSGPKQWGNMRSQCKGQVAGKEYTPQECYIRSLELDPNCALAWNSLGVEGGGRVCPVGQGPSLNSGVDTARSETARRASGVDYNKRQCYVRSIELDPQCSRAWNNLGAEGGGRVSLPEGKLEFTQKQCYVRALELDPNLNSALRNLGILMALEEPMEHSSRESLAEQEVYRAAMYDPSNMAYANNSRSYQDGHRSSDSERFRQQDVMGGWDYSSNNNSRQSPTNSRKNLEQSSDQYGMVTSEERTTSRGSRERTGTAGSGNRRRFEANR